LEFFAHFYYSFADRKSYVVSLTFNLLAGAEFSQGYLSFSRILFFPAHSSTLERTRQRSRDIVKVTSAVTRSQKMLGVRFRECLSSKVPQIYYNIIFIRFNALKYCPCLSGL